MCRGSCALFLACGFRGGASGGACVDVRGRGNARAIEIGSGNGGLVRRSRRVGRTGVCARLVVAVGDGASMSRYCRSPMRRFRLAGCFLGRRSGRVRVASGCVLVGGGRLGSHFECVVWEARSRMLQVVWRGRVGLQV